MEVQGVLFDEWEELNHSVRPISIQNRRYLGNKYRLLPFIEQVVSSHCGKINSVADIFAGTGSVASLFQDKQIITNDILYCNYLCHIAWFGDQIFSQDRILDLLSSYNQTVASEDNYMSENYSDTYFSRSVCRQIGFIREDIEKNYRDSYINFRERAILTTSLLYAMDRIANTCGHYDAWRRQTEFASTLELRMPDVSPSGGNLGNQCYNLDANDLVRNIQADLVYIDPPYNSRQYADSYHLLENVARWDKPEVFGVARKMDRQGMKSRYCTRQAAEAFEDLIAHVQANQLLVSYNNMAQNGDGRSNAKISDTEIMSILSSRGIVQTFSLNYKSFSAGKSFRQDNEERLFLVAVR